MNLQGCSMENLALKTDGAKLARLSQELINERNRRNAELRENLPKFPVPVYADADEASNAYREFMLQPDAEQKLLDANERLNDLFAKEDAQLWVLSSNPTEDEKRSLLGYEEKVRPELPGVATSYVHIQGNLEKVREQIADLQREISQFRIHAARYQAVKKSFDLWPIHRINQERNARVRRQDIVAGRLV